MNVVDRLAEMVRATPAACAVETDRERINYKDLADRVARVAAELGRRGVGREDLVAVSAASSPDLIAGVLGVMVAGAGFAVFDPTYPAARLAAVLEVARPRVVLLDDGALDLPVYADQVRVPLAIARAAEPAPPWPRPAFGARQLAYVVFTSGTTGVPKGVAIEHRGLGNLVERQIEAFAIDPGSRLLQFASPSFDAFVSEVLTALCAGATLCLTGRAGASFDADVAQLLEGRAISVVTLPPSLLRAMPDRALPALRTLVSAGEPCSPDVVDRWAPGRRFVNAYGPSEVTVCSTWRTVTAGERPTLGAALGGLTTHVLGDGGAPVAVGQRGELHVGGVGVGRGYLGRPGQTAERFVPDPWATTPGARMYRTGDLVEARAGGDVDFVGRVDHQIKLRGFRIEPGEIEHALRDAPGVRDALVAERRRPGGEGFLVGYLLVDGDAPIDRAALRRHLRRRVPRFMRPSAFVELAAWPMTKVGKVDREALARLPLAPAQAHRHADADQAAVAGWFAELLGLEGVGPDQSFIDLGGDSILVLRLRQRIEAERGVRVPLARLLERPTVRAVAAAIVGGRPPDADDDVVLLSTTGDGPPLWLVAPVHGNALCYLTLAAELDGDRPVYGLSAPGLEGDRPPIDDFERLAAHHVAAIRRHQPSGPYHLAGWSMGGSIAFAMANQLAAAGAAVAGLTLIGSSPPSDDHIAASRANLSPFEVWRISYMYARTMGLSLGLELDLSMKRFRGLSDADALDLLGETLRGAGPFGEGTTRADIGRWVAVFRASLYGFLHYAAPTFHGPATVIHPTGTNVFLQSDELVVNKVPPGDWRNHIDGPIEFRSVAGTHYNLVLAPWVDAVADLLRVGRGSAT